MSDVILNEVRKGFYLDSVALMRLSREIASIDGVTDAALMMGSPSNLAIMHTAGLLDAGTVARNNDLVLAIRACNQALADSALASATATLDRPKAGAVDTQTWHPRSIAAAVRGLENANLALVSVPAGFAAAEARKALRRGLNVLLFSDNVSLDDELSLKQEAQELGLLMMGPDCGTAIINGAPLAFANRVNRGSIGLIGASGTGIQEVSCLISQAGSGISHAIGVGGRDLKQEIGGITTLMAMHALEHDSTTESVILISKPPHPDVAKVIIARIGQSRKPYTVCFIGADTQNLPANAQQVTTLREAAEHALGGPVVAPEFDLSTLVTSASTRDSRSGRIEGLFCGGTLCAEAQVILLAGGRRPVSNAPIPGVAALGEKEQANVTADRLIDLGADEYTLGRPHPMIDPSVRDELFSAALQDADVAVVLVDLVIGYGANENPARHLAEIHAARGPLAPPVIASVTGTQLDPQQRSTQIATLEQSGIMIAPSNAHACELALAIVAD